MDPGSEFTLRVGATDAGDGALATTALVDDFQWSANPGTVQTGNACKLGGTGACLTCNQAATAAGGCCDKETQACLADPDCAKIAFCSGFCGGSVTCQQGCYAQTPAGQPEYDKVLQCLYATVDTSDPKNKGACGVSCGLQAPLALASFRREERGSVDFVDRPSCRLSAPSRCWDGTMFDPARAAVRASVRGCVMLRRPARWLLRRRSCAGDSDQGPQAHNGQATGSSIHTPPVHVRCAPVLEQNTP